MAWRNALSDIKMQGSLSYFPAGILLKVYIGPLSGEKNRSDTDLSIMLAGMFPTPVTTGSCEHSTYGETLVTFIIDSRYLEFQGTL